MKILRVLIFADFAEKNTTKAVTFGSIKNLKKSRQRVKVGYMSCFFRVSTLHLSFKGKPNRIFFTLCNIYHLVINHKQY